MTIKTLLLATLLLLSYFSFSQLVLNGKIKNEKDEPLSGASVLLENKQTNASVNNSGLLKDALGLVDKPYISNGSFNSFKTGNPSNDIIGHIFVTKHFSVKRYGILTDTYHGKFPSDHYPVLTELVLNK